MATVSLSSSGQGAVGPVEKHERISRIKHFRPYHVEVAVLGFLCRL